MPDNDRAWAAAIGLTDDEADAFEQLVRPLGVTPAELLRRMATRVIETDRTMRSYGLNGLTSWTSAEAAVRLVADHSLTALPIDLRETEFMWPADLPFPWSAEECKAAVIGYEVRWRGSFDDFCERLRGKWELSDGYAVLHQP